MLPSTRITSVSSLSSSSSLFSRLFSSTSRMSSSSPRPFNEFHPARRLAKFSAPTVWHEFTPLAQQSGAVNLGQGFPGWSTPAFVRDAAASAVLEKNADFMINQYARSAGHLNLVKALAKKYSPTIGKEIDPLTEIVVADGASEALCAAMLGLLNEGDEVIAFEPAFDIYIAQAEMCGAVMKTVPLHVKDGKWVADFNELEKTFSKKTRMLLLNTPHNPTGKVFNKEEIEKIIAIIEKFPEVIVVADEVYEHMIYDGQNHISFASLPNMWQRTLTISSAGKTFSTTGWKIGWAIGPENLAKCVQVAHQWLCFSVATPLQQGIADSLAIAEKEYEGFPSYYAHLNDMYKKKRQILCDHLRAAGITPIVPEGGFFIIGDTSNIQLPEPYASDKSVTRDWALCRWLTKEIGVAAIPPSSFCNDESKHLVKNYARFAFCKPDEVLHAAGQRLLKCRDFLIKKD